MKKLPCKFEAKGNCKYGYKCLYKHERKRRPRYDSFDYYSEDYNSEEGYDSSDPGWGEMMEISGDDEVKGDYTEFSANVGQIYRDLVRIDPVRKVISGNRSVDIMFIIDISE